MSGATPLTGHLLPAASALGAALATYSVYSGCVPPFSVAADALPQGINFAAALLQKDIGCAIANTFGLSGEHAAITFTAFH